MQIGTKVLLYPAYGQVGQELIRALSPKVGLENIVCADSKLTPSNVKVIIHETLNILDKQALFDIIDKHQVQHLYCLPIVYSAQGEKNPLGTEQILMKSLLNCLEAGRQKKVERIFWPSSVAAFGENAPKNTPQFTIMQPTTVYGITKKSGQLWCNYYHTRYGVDVRSVRFPGKIGYRSPLGGGTTDYGVQIFHRAVLGQKFICNLKQDSYLPMIYTDDAIEGILQLMDAPSQNIKIRTSYNIHSMTFGPKQLAEVVQQLVPSFEIQYKIDPIRQKIADSWPHSLQDKHARQDWGWNPKYDITKMTKQILQNLTPQKIKAMSD